MKPNLMITPAALRGAALKLSAEAGSETCDPKRMREALDALDEEVSKLEDEGADEDGEKKKAPNDGGLDKDTEGDKKQLSDKDADKQNEEALANMMAVHGPQAPRGRAAIMPSKPSTKTDPMPRSDVRALAGMLASPATARMPGKGADGRFTIDPLLTPTKLREELARREGK